MHEKGPRQRNCSTEVKRVVTRHAAQNKVCSMQVLQK